MSGGKTASSGTPPGVSYADILFLPDTWPLTVIWKTRTSLEAWCASLETNDSLVTLATFQVFSGHMWLVATSLDMWGGSI